MGIGAGLVGLPNVGKSTLFNALTNSSVPAENYPFCTIDPHLACAVVPDTRVAELQQLYSSKKTIPTSVQFVDIAGLVKGAASGEGLGNQFLSHIRAVNLILHVVRCFEDPDITNTRLELDPLLDYEIIQQELMLKDLESIEKRVTKVAQLIKSSKNNQLALKELEAEAALLPQLTAAIDANNMKKIAELLQAHAHITLGIDLLCAKNFLVIANVKEQEMENESYKNNSHFQKLIAHFGADKVIPVSARLELELAVLNPAEREEMMQFLGIKERALDKIIEKTYKSLDLITFFTCGPQEIHAWTIKAGTTVRAASGEIHSDLEKGFICADIFNYNDIATYKTVSKLKEAGRMRTEGQDYIVKDGDIIHVKFNV